MRVYVAILEGSKASLFVEPQARKVGQLLDAHQTRQIRMLAARLTESRAGNQMRIRAQDFFTGLKQLGFRNICYFGRTLFLSAGEKPGRRTPVDRMFEQVERFLDHDGGGAPTNAVMVCTAERLRALFQCRDARLKKNKTQDICPGAIVFEADDGTVEVFGPEVYAPNLVAPTTIPSPARSYIVVTPLTH